MHLGSFYDSRPVRQGIEVLRGEKPDVICFTGDLVNYETAEAKPYFAILQHLKAPLGVFSVLGNHDYGGYRQWPNAEAARQNLRQMYALHQALGWQLLRNAHTFLEENQEKIALIGVENWGIRKPHPRFGDVEKAKQGTAEAPVRILLSHDPSHWEAKVQPLAPEIDLMLAGHTHGFQCGIEIGTWQWSPVQYIYKQWAGLYQEKAQQLYVNRGFGYADIFPGRIGMPPEITVLELLKA
ncbi:MAG: hypothetical protein HC913_18795 [Microscillaceae bacterium]|nr:hypothetical protein [Microscillaceae bacterium]